MATLCELGRGLGTTARARVGSGHETTCTSARLWPSMEVVVNIVCMVGTIWNTPCVVWSSLVYTSLHHGEVDSESSQSEKR